MCLNLPFLSIFWTRHQKTQLKKTIIFSCGCDWSQPITFSIQSQISGIANPSPAKLPKPPVPPNSPCFKNSKPSFFSARRFSEQSCTKTSDTANTRYWLLKWSKTRMDATHTIMCKRTRFIRENESEWIPLIAANNYLVGRCLLICSYGIINASSRVLDHPVASNPTFTIACKKPSLLPQYNVFLAIEDILQLSRRHSLDDLYVFVDLHK